jgi:hypothetical protein
MAQQTTNIPAPGTTVPVDGGRVELTVVDDAIWLSSYQDDKHQFTLVVPRKSLEGSVDAKEGVSRRARNGGRKAAFKMAVSAMERFKLAPPARAGFWYEDPNFKGHGGPLVIVEE